MSIDAERLEAERANALHKNEVAAKLIWALLEDRHGTRTPEALEITGTVKQALDAARKAFFE